VLLVVGSGRIFFSTPFRPPSRNTTKSSPRLNPLRPFPFRNSSIAFSRHPFQTKICSLCLTVRCPFWCGSLSPFDFRFIARLLLSRRSPRRAKFFRLSRTEESELISEGARGAPPYRSSDSSAARFFRLNSSNMFFRRCLLCSRKSYFACLDVFRTVLSLDFVTAPTPPTSFPVNRRISRILPFACMKTPAPPVF